MGLERVRMVARNQRRNRRMKWRRKLVDKLECDQSEISAGRKRFTESGGGKEEEEGREEKEGGEEEEGGRRRW